MRFFLSIVVLLSVACGGPEHPAVSPQDGGNSSAGGHTGGAAGGSSPDVEGGSGPSEQCLWTELDTGTSTPLRGFSRNIAVGSFLGSSIILEYSEGSWTKTHAANDEGLHDVWVGNDTAFAVGYDEGGFPRILEKKTSGWVQVENVPSGMYEGVWGVDDQDVFAVGFGGISRFSDDSWQKVSDTDVWLHDVWASSSTDAFAVGGTSEGAVLHFDGDSWSPMSLPEVSGLYSVWGTSSDNVYAVGLSGVLRYDGNQWEQMDVPFTGILFENVWGTSAQDVFLVGTELAPGKGAVVHHDGSAWVRMELGDIGALSAIGGDSETNIFAVGGLEGSLPTQNVVHFGCD